MEIVQPDYETFLDTVKALKPRLTAREEAASSNTLKRSSTSLTSSNSIKTPHRESPAPKRSVESNQGPVTHSVLEKMLDLIAKQTQAIENVASQVSNFASKSDYGASNLDETFESVPDTTTDEEIGAPSLNVLPQENRLPTSAKASQSSSTILDTLFKPILKFSPLS
ncbi:unnamed protein product [Colias eurytheme]|nr:unnamed protein product [Colias eurytheme]